jgi:hypothetical protein
VQLEVLDFEEGVVLAEEGVVPAEEGVVSADPDFGDVEGCCQGAWVDVVGIGVAAGLAQLTVGEGFVLMDPGLGHFERCNPEAWQVSDKAAAESDRTRKRLAGVVGMSLM